MARAKKTGHAVNVERQSYEKMKGQIDEVWEEGVRQPATEVVRAAHRVIGIARKLADYRSEMQLELPNFDLSNIDELETSARALLHAHWKAVGRPIRVREDIAAANGLRKEIGFVAKTLAEVGLLPAAEVRALCEGRKPLDVVAGLTGLVSLLRSHWEEIEDKMWLDAVTLARAEKLGLELAPAVGLSDTDVAFGGPDEAGLRAAAFTVMERKLHQCRRAMSYLRWDDEDVDELVPTLYPKVKRKRTTDDGATSKEGSADKDASSSEGEAPPKSEAPQPETTGDKPAAKPPAAPKAEPTAIAPSSASSLTAPSEGTEPSESAPVNDEVTDCDAHAA